MMIWLIMVLCPVRLFETNNPPPDRQDWDVWHSLEHQFLFYLRDMDRLPFYQTPDRKEAVNIWPGWLQNSPQSTTEHDCITNQGTKGKSAAKLCDMRIIAFPRVPHSCNLGCPPTYLISPKRTKNEGMSSCRNARVRFVQENGANNLSNCACFVFKP